MAALFGLAALGEVGGAISLRAVQNRKRRYARRARCNKMTLETSETVEKRGRWLRCAGCGKDFNNRRQDARFCSAACKQDSYRRRLAAKAAAIARDLEAAKRRKEAEAEAIRKAIDLAHSLIG